MTPGYLAGQYTAADITSDVQAIARRAGARCVIGAAARLDPAKGQVALQDGRTLPYDLVSFNIGSLLAGSHGPAAAHAERIKPLHRVARLKERLDALADGDRTQPARVVVIGAGAGGVEVAFAAAATLDRDGRAREITIVDRGRRVLNSYSGPFQRLAERALEGARHSSPARRRGHGGGCRSGRARRRGSAPQRPDGMAHGTPGGATARAPRACRPSRGDFYGSRIPPEHRRSAGVRGRRLRHLHAVSRDRQVGRVCRPRGAHPLAQPPGRGSGQAARELSAAAVVPLHPQHADGRALLSVQGASQLEPVGLVAEGSDRPGFMRKYQQLAIGKRHRPLRHPERSEGGMLPGMPPSLRSG